MRHCQENEDKPHTRRKYLQNTYLTEDWYPKYTNNSQNSKKTTDFKKGHKI